MAIQTSAVDMHLRSSVALGLTSASAFSITCWVNANWSATGTQSIIGIYGPTTDTPLGAPVTAVQLGTRETNPGAIFAWTWGGGALAISANNFMTPLNNTWVNLCYTTNGTTHRIYVNGVEAVTGTGTQITGFLNQVYVNGFPNSGAAEVATYQLDQYSLLLRELTPGEVLTIYNAGGGRHGIYFGRTARYEFDELGQGAQVTFVPDFSGGLSALTPTGLGANFTYTYPGTFANSNTRPSL